MVGALSASSGLEPGGTQMMGRYAPVARLGTGGMADVFLTLAHGPQGVNKLTVVKRLRDPENAALTEMFLDEARLAARLNHPNIVHTYEVGEARGEYFIAMEYLEGQPLNQVLKQLDARGEGLSDSFVAFIALQALKGLHYAHEFCDFDGSPLGVVHRDVSPHNLFLTYGGEIKLLDFGIAKAAVNVTHTEDGILKGKVRYMAPEQATTTDVDRRADIYAFGIVLWEMLARRPLFTGAPLSILTRIVNEEVPPVRGVRPEVSPTLEAIALKAVRRERDERYPTADAMRVDLETYVRGRSDIASERDLARLMNEMFAATRDSVRAQVRAYVATMATSGSTLPSSPGITGTGSLPVLPTWGTPSASRSSSAPPPPDDRSDRSTRSESILRSPPPVRRSRWPLVVTTFLSLVAASAAGVFALRNPHAVGGHWGSEATAQSRATLPAPAPVVVKPRLSVVTTPPGARVEWNGVGVVGSTPVTFAIQPGTQTIRLSRDGYESAALAVDLQPGEEATRTLTLRPISRAPASTPSSSAALPAPSPPPPPTHHHGEHGGRSTVAAPVTPEAPTGAPAPPASAPTSRPNIQMLDESESQ